jgi:integrase
MAKPRKLTKADGSTFWIAQVLVKPFKRVSKTFPTKREAVEWADALQMELRSKRKAVRSDLTKLSVAQLTREFLDDPQTKALRTYTSLEPLIAWWVNRYGGMRVLDFSVLTAREARDKLVPGRAPATTNRYLSAMRSCWNWARSQGLLPQDRLWPSKLMLREPRGRTRFLSNDELQRLLKEAAPDPLMHAAVMVSLGCGVRQSELLRLKWGDIDFDRERLLVLLTKNGESRAVHLPKSAAGALLTLKRSPLVGTQVFINPAGQPMNKDKLERRWRLLRDAAGLKDFRWHDLRHSCASFLAQEGANLLEIGAVLGHKSPSVTKRYSHLIEGAPVTGSAKLDEKLRGGK